MLLAAYRGDEERTAGLVATTTDSRRPRTAKADHRVRGLRLRRASQRLFAVMSGPLECARRLFDGELVGLPDPRPTRVRRGSIEAGARDTQDFACRWVRRG